MFQSNLPPPSKSEKFKRVLRLEDRENKLLLNVSIYNETPILHYCFHILHAFMYFLYSSSYIPLTIMFNYNRILHLFIFTFYWNLHFLFLVLMTKIYFILHPTVLFSKFSLTPSDIAKCQVNVPNRSIHVVLWLLNKNYIQQSVQVF